MPTDRTLPCRPRKAAPFRCLPLARRVALPMLAALTLLAAALPSGAAAAASLPAEGIFENCHLDTQMPTCLQRLGVMRTGGFNVVVIDADQGSPTSDASYASAAQGLGMKVLWEISDPGWWQGTPVSGDFPGFGPACGCSDNSSLLTYMIHYLGSLPGTFGYYAADDSMLGAGAQTAVSRYVSQIKAVDPSHSTILSSGDEQQTSLYESVGDMNAAENYPVTNSSMMPVSRNQDEWNSIGQWAKDVQGIANRHGKASAFILQAFSWGDNLADGQAIGLCTASMSPAQCWDAAMYPTSADQLQMRNEVLKHADPSLILWWSFMGTYGQAGSDTYSTYPTGSAATDHWAGLTAAINAPAPVRLTHGKRVKKRQHKRHHHKHRHHQHHRHHRHHRRHRRPAAQRRHPHRLV